MKRFLLSLLTLAVISVAWADQVTLKYSFKVTQTNVTTSPLTLSKTNSSAAGTCVFTFAVGSGKTLTAQNNSSSGPLFGSKNAPLVNAVLKVTPDESVLPENAIIKDVKLLITGNAGTSVSTWKVTIGETEITETKTTSTGSTSSTLDWPNLNIKGSDVTFTATSVTAGFNLGEAWITYEEQSGPADFTFDWTGKSVTLDVDDTMDEAKFVAALGIPTEHEHPTFTFSIAEEYNDVAEVIDNEICAYAKGDAKLNVSWGDDETWTKNSTTLDLKISAPRTPVTLAWDVENGSITADLAKVTTLTPTLKGLPEGLSATYGSSNTDAATIGADGVITLKAVGETTITAKFAGNADYAASDDASFLLKVIDPANEPLYELVINKNNYTTDTPSLQNYTTTWSYNYDNKTWSFVNFSNNQKSWDFIACGAKSNSTAAIVNTFVTEEIIDRIVINFESVSLIDKWSKFSLLIADNINFNNASSIELTKPSVISTATDYTISIPKEYQKAKCYYKLVFECTAAGSNGFIRINSIKYYGHEDEPQPYTYNGVSSLTFDLEDTLTFTELEAMLEVTEEHPTFSYAFSDTDMFYIEGEDIAILEEGDANLTISWDAEGQWLGGDTTVAIHVNGQKDYIYTGKTALTYEENDMITTAQLLSDLAVKGVHPDFKLELPENDYMFYQKSDDTYNAALPGTVNLIVSWNSGKGYTKGSATVVITITKVLKTPAIKWCKDDDDFTEYTAKMWEGKTIEFEIVSDVEDLTYTSSDENVATVAVDGEYIQIALVGKGEATITAHYAGDTEEYKAYDAELKLTVEDLAEPKILPAAQTIVLGDYVTMTCETEDAEIWYTINGGEREQYFEPIQITEDTPVNEDGRVVFKAYSVIPNTDYEKACTANGFRIQRPNFDFRGKNAHEMGTISDSNTWGTKTTETITSNDGLVSITFSGSQTQNKQNVDTWRHWESTNTTTGAKSYDLRLYKDCEMVFTCLEEEYHIESIQFDGQTVTTVKILDQQLTAKENKWTAEEDKVYTSVTCIATGGAKIEHITVVLTKPLEMFFHDTASDYQIDFAHEDHINLYSGEIKTLKFHPGNGYSLHYCDHKGSVAPHSAPGRALSDEHTWAESVDGTVTISGDGALYLTAKKGEFAAEPVMFTYKTMAQTGIEGVAAEAKAEAEYFNLQGIRVANPASGVYLRRQRGTVSKVVIR